MQSLKRGENPTKMLESVPNILSSHREKNRLNRHLTISSAKEKIHSSNNLFPFALKHLQNSSIVYQNHRCSLSLKVILL